MKLNFKNAEAKNLLEKRPANRRDRGPYPILHFGVGGFHRAHQAWALQQMQSKAIAGADFEDWAITGVSVLPADKGFVEAFRGQDCLGFVQRFDPDGNHKVSLLESIREILFVEQDYSTILACIAASETKVISFTITEGGYNVDYNQHRFIWGNPAVQEDLLKGHVPKTVFRILAEGLKKRKEVGNAGIVLMSCDNVQHNGAILKFAFLEFLKKFDPALISWAEDNVSFVSTMVDRITPVTTSLQKEDFAREYDFEDNCLVVCEDFFQWVIGKDPRLEGLPYAKMGATLVDDVAPYEKMKLRLLNGGHSLIGLLGYALGYDSIHTAISDDLIGSVFRRYTSEEVIPTLAPIEGVDYPGYVDQLAWRFSNPMINDSTLRIISGSTDKLPKFVLPVILENLSGSAIAPQIKWGVLIVAAWYYYLLTESKKNRMQDVQDLNKSTLLSLFERPGFDPEMFIKEDPLFEGLREHTVARMLFTSYTHALMSTGTAAHDARRRFIAALLEKKEEVGAYE